MFERASAFDDLPDNIADLVNETAESLWLAVPGAPARELAMCLPNVSLEESRH
jgi:hypothetical protein